MCQLGLTCSNGVANDGNIVPEQFFPTLPTGISDLGVVRPETDAPQWAKRAGFSQTFRASVQKVLSHGRILCELDTHTGKDGVFPKAVPDGEVEVTHAPADAFVFAWIWRGHNQLRCAVVLKKARLFSHYVLLRAGIRHVVNCKRQGGPLPHIGGGGLTEESHLLR